ncbi:MAG: hypothetical protein QM795_09060 [Pseudoxanthomonas sp.]
MPPSIEIRLRRDLALLLLALTIATPFQASALGPEDLPATPADVTAQAGEHGADRGLAILRDPDDGRLDASRWLLERKGGFLPVPILVSDPALGSGGGIGAAFFRPNRAGGTAVDPDLYGAGVIRTSNETEAYGVGASLHFAEDRWRYRGLVGKASVNLDFHLDGPLMDSPRSVAYNIDGIATFQQVQRRLGREPWYAGVAWIYMDMDVTFKRPEEGALIPDRDLGATSSGIGVMIQHDSRDNAFTASRGGFTAIDATFYTEGLGSDTEFQSYRGRSFRYFPVGDRLVAGLRADLRVADGRVPFYRLPYIELRGIGAARYQDTRAAVVETEVRWKLDQRWSLLAFAGGGRTWGRRGSFSDGGTRTAQGAGVRYLIARQLGLHVGADYAWGPEDRTVYVQFGSAWR